MEAKHLSRASMEKILASLRRQFDTIVIDTGPLLGSLEANLAASLSDGVVLCVSRGQSSKFVNACLERLRRMGAPIAGLVFNRAKASDFSRSVSAGSVCSQSLRPPGPGEKPRDAEARRAARGALVRAVMGSGESGPAQPSPIGERSRTVATEPKA
jgi:Mrp family chromosome partitioning ATPase